MLAFVFFSLYLYTLLIYHFFLFPSMLKAGDHRQRVIGIRTEIMANQIQIEIHKNNLTKTKIISKFRHEKKS